MLWLREIDDRTAVEVQGALFARAMGADVPVPDRDEIRARFHDLLCEDSAEVEPAAMSRRDILIEAFGLTGGR